MSESRILLVEDNHINQVVAGKILARGGLTADVADSGEKALQLLAERPYDLVLMDIRLPGIDGVETSRRIRSGESGVLNPDVAIIALTAYSSDEDHVTCISAGMNDYLSKPLEINRFLEVVSNYVQPPSDGEQGDGTDTTSEARSPETSGRDTPLFDRNTLDAQLGGDDALAEVAVATFLGLLDRKLLRLEGAVANDRDEDAYREAHAIAGAAGNVAAARLEGVLREIEALSRSGRLDEARQLLPVLQEIARETRTILEEFRRDHSP
ncbi:MAG: response regulator [Spirochaetaceae bacterium]